MIKSTITHSRNSDMSELSEKYSSKNLQK